MGPSGSICVGSQRGQHAPMLPQKRQTSLYVGEVRYGGVYRQRPCPSRPVLRVPLCLGDCKAWLCGEGGGINHFDAAFSVPGPCCPNKVRTDRVSLRRINLSTRSSRLVPTPSKVQREVLEIHLGLCRPTRCGRENNGTTKACLFRFGDSVR